MISMLDARNYVMSGCLRLNPHHLKLKDALGCVLAEDLAAAISVPSFANSAMDGYAIRSQDVENAPVELEVVGLSLAGIDKGLSVGPGQAVRIMTGAAIPAGPAPSCAISSKRLPSGSSRR